MKMIESTFCHLPNISLAEEKTLWRKGLKNWDDLLCWAAVYYNDKQYCSLEQAIARSRGALHMKNADYFLTQLPPSEVYRIYPDFHEQISFLDIETDGLGENAAITCLSILDSRGMKTFLFTDNLDAAKEPLSQLSVVVTFHGTQFDIPRLMMQFAQFRMRHHIDLAKVLRLHKIRGSLKEVALRFGWKQNKSTSTIQNGKEAAEAWTEYRRTGNRAILEELSKYNQADVRMLKFIMQNLVTQCATRIGF